MTRTSEELRRNAQLGVLSWPSQCTANRLRFDTKRAGTVASSRSVHPTHEAIVTRLHGTATSSTSSTVTPHGGVTTMDHRSMAVLRSHQYANESWSMHRHQQAARTLRPITIRSTTGATIAPACRLHPRTAMQSTELELLHSVARQPKIYPTTTGRPPIRPISSVSKYVLSSLVELPLN